MINASTQKKKNYKICNFSAYPCHKTANLVTVLYATYKFVFWLITFIGKQNIILKMRDKMKIQLKLQVFKKYLEPCVILYSL